MKFNNFIFFFYIESFLDNVSFLYNILHYIKED